MRTDKEDTIIRLFDLGECAAKVIIGPYHGSALLFSPAGGGIPAQNVWISFGKYGAPETQFDAFVVAVKQAYAKEREA